MKISTIVSSHNKGFAVARAVRSALMQSHPPLEVVVAEDASTDDSRDVLAHLAGQFPALRVLYYPRKSDDWMMSYLGHTECLRGDYVHLLAADDFIAEPGFYAAVAKAVDVPAPPGVVFGNVRCYRPDGKALGQSRYDLLPGLHHRSQELKRWLESGSLVGGTATVLSREACAWLRENGAHRAGPWFDSAIYPAAMWAYGCHYLPPVYGCFTEDPNGYGNQRDPEVRRRYREGCEAFFSEPGVGERLGSMADTLLQRVK